MAGMAKKTLLVIDDDRSVLDSLADTLRTEDFEVVSAANGDEAWTHFTNDNRSIDACLLDLNLGRESGYDTFSRIRQHRPWLPVILMTGEPARFAHPLADSAAARFTKPIHIGELVTALNSLTSAAKETAFARGWPENTLHRETHRSCGANA
jgi:DNA-binding response OmpR family regulator